MKKMNQQGFSLVELMVVVAIIGILSAVAIPQYQKFQAKSRQSEAKSSLGGLYTAMSAFKAEWGMYFGDFEDIGYDVDGDVYYVVGFDSDGTRSPDHPQYNGDAGQDAVADEYDTETHANSNISVIDLSGNGCAAAANLPAGTWDGVGDTFTANAHGDVDNDNTCDNWEIDQDKALRNTANDVNT